jgi:hypothetical protein
MPVELTRQARINKNDSGFLLGEFGCVSDEVMNLLLAEGTLVAGISAKNDEDSDAFASFSRQLDGSSVDR